MDIWTKKQNRYKDHEIWWLNFPDGITPNDVEVFGYNQGERINSKQPVNLDLFDSISFFSWTYNHSDKGRKTPMIIALANRSNSGSNKVLILKLKKNAN